MDLIPQERQEYIDNLILSIETAEDPASVTNEIVAAVLDYLNAGYKDLKPVKSTLAQETADREAGDATLSHTIDTLLHGNATTAIENFNEVVSFLEGITDSETLADKLAQLRLAVDSKLDKSKVDRTSISDDCFAVPSSQAVLGTFRAMSEVMALKSDVVQATGDGEGKVMSQAAVSRELRSLRDTTDGLESDVENLTESKADQTYVEQVQGAVQALGQNALASHNQLSQRISTLEGRHVALTEAEYEALAEKDENTIYLIYEDDTL